MLKRLLLACLLLFILAPVMHDPAPALARDTGEGINESALNEKQRANVAVLDHVLGVVRHRFYDRTYGGIDLRDMRVRYLSDVIHAEPGDDLYRVLRTMLAEFKVSHLTVIAGDVYRTYFTPEMGGEPTRQPGFSLVEIEPGKLFATNLLHGGAAEKAGMLRGDRVVRINGAPAAGSEFLADAGGDPGLPGKPAYVLRLSGHDELVVDVRRRPDSDELIEIRIRPEEASMIRATANSIRVIEHEGRRYGYIRFWHFLHMDIAHAFRRALENEFKDCDGLVIDLRGRGGNPAVMNACFVPFGSPVPAGRRSLPDMPRWTRPVVALQDGGSRSAKEVYAHNWKWLGLGPLVGESTPGAVLYSQFLPMPDGGHMIVPMQDARGLTYGRVDLEGNPVRPTHPVKDLLPYAQGADTIYEAGVKVLHELCKKESAPAPEKFPRPEEREEAFSVR